MDNPHQCYSYYIINNIDSTTITNKKYYINNIIINADLNGAIGILRKVVDESYFDKIINRGFVINPVKVNILTKTII